jgi:hypothetical protein
MICIRVLLFVVHFGSTTLVRNFFSKESHILYVLMGEQKFLLIQEFLKLEMN